MDYDTGGTYYSVNDLYFHTYALAYEDDLKDRKELPVNLRFIELRDIVDYRLKNNEAELDNYLDRYKKGEGPMQELNKKDVLKLIMDYRNSNFEALINVLSDKNCSPERKAQFYLDSVQCLSILYGKDATQMLEFASSREILDNSVINLIEIEVCKEIEHNPESRGKIAELFSQNRDSLVLIRPELNLRSTRRLIDYYQDKGMNENSLDLFLCFRYDKNSFAEVKDIIGALIERNLNECYIENKYENTYKVIEMGEELFERTQSNWVGEKTAEILAKLVDVKAFNQGEFKEFQKNLVEQNSVFWKCMADELSLNQQKSKEFAYSIDTLYAEVTALKGLIGPEAVKNFGEERDPYLNELLDNKKLDWPIELTLTPPIQMDRSGR